MKAHVSLRDLFWLIALLACVCGWAVHRHQMVTRNNHLQAEVERLKKGPDWAGMDRIMDQYALHWDLLQKRERELGIPETPDPFDELPIAGDPEPGDPVPKVEAAIWPKDIND